MRIFISWSGARSSAVAKALKDWIPNVLYDATVWMSEHDLDAGVRWSHKLAEVLQESQAGIICLTPENQSSKWILFEAGAISKSIHESRLVPYLLDMAASDVASPLSQFQAVSSDSAGTLTLLQSINGCCTSPLDDIRLRRQFEKWWPELEPSIRTALQIAETGRRPSGRSDRDVLDEILQIMRTFSTDRDAAKSPSVTIDTRPFSGKRGYVSTLAFNSTMAVSDFLDAVFFKITGHSKIKAYTYGESWLLKDARSNKVYDNIGIEYCKSGGSIKENLPVSAVGINTGDCLLVIPIDQSKLS